MDLDSVLIGFPVGIVCGILLDRFVLTPLVIWHARVVRRGRGS